MTATGIVVDTNERIDLPEWMTKTSGAQARWNAAPSFDRPPADGWRIQMEK
jgi:hypothetical protein